MVPDIHDIAAIGGLGIGILLIYGFVRYKEGEQAQTAAADAAYTPDVIALTNGETPLALDTGGGGIVDTLPTVGLELDAYTGDLSSGIDPTTGEIGIANQTDTQLGLVQPLFSLEPANAAS